MSVDPSSPFGTDVWIGPNAQGILDLDPSLREVSGIDVLVQSVLMRITTPTGSAIDAPDDCFDMRRWISKGMTVAQLAQLKSLIQGQLLRDQRIISATVGVSFSFATSILTVTMAIQSSLGPFTLTLNVSAVTVQMLVTQ
jgi:hypothetical protein